MTAPEIRINGFDGEWGKTNIGTHSEVRNGRDYKHLSPGNIPVYGTGGHMLSVDQALSFDEDAIGIGRKGTIDHPYVLKAPFWTVDTLFWVVPNSTADLAFLYGVFQGIDWKSKNQSTGLPSLTQRAVSGAECNFPPNLDEQRAVGGFFGNLDTLLENQQARLTQLRRLKETMLSKMFPRAGESVPEIRFDGFDGEWSIKLLADCAGFSKGNGYSKSDLRPSGERILLYGSLYTNYKTEISAVNTFVAEKPNSVYSAGTEVVVPASGESAEDIVRASAVTSQGIILGGDLNVIRPAKEIDQLFLALTISNGQQDELTKRAQGNTIVHLRNSDLRELQFALPSLAEQRAIGSYFTKLDRLIELEQAKHVKFQQLKAAFLNKMFV